MVLNLRQQFPFAISYLFLFYAKEKKKKKKPVEGVRSLTGPAAAGVAVSTVLAGGVVVAGL